jgi:hypothetical protein
VITIPFSVIDGALDWHGLHVSMEDNTMIVSEGRIGLSYNPLTIVDDCVGGGWYVKTTQFNIDNIERVDILMKGDNTYFLLRSQDMDEIYPDEYELLLSLAFKSGDEWFYYRPRRQHETTDYS